MKKIILSFVIVASALSSSFGQWTLSGSNLTTTNKVGIGTTAPQDLLQVGSGAEKIAFGSAYGQNTGWGTSYVGFNVAKSAANNWLTNTDGGNNGGSLIYGNVGGTINFVTFPSTGNSVQNLTDSKLVDFTRMKIDANGKVGIGVSWFSTNNLNAQGNPYLLYVKGGIKTEEIKVEMSGGTWGDYVFAEDYKLTSLPEVEQHIAKTGHLHNIASAAEIEEEGLELKSMTINQQEKIEEIFLHLIEMDKKMKALEEKIKQLEAEKAALGK